MMKRRMLAGGMAVVLSLMVMVLLYRLGQVDS